MLCGTGIDGVCFGAVTVTGSLIRATALLRFRELCSLEKC
jgi:hypothetical protein